MVAEHCSRTFNTGCEGCSKGEPCRRMTTSHRTVRSIILLAALAVGCSSRHVRIGPAPPASYQTLGPSEGSGCGLLLLNINSHPGQLAHGASLRQCAPARRYGAD